MGVGAIPVARTTAPTHIFTGIKMPKNEILSIENLRMKSTEIAKLTNKLHKNVLFVIRDFLEKGLLKSSQPILYLEQMQAIEHLQKINTSMLDLAMDYQERKEKLRIVFSNKYQTKVLH